jgi:hypothetical protein
LLLAAALVVAAILASKGITDETVVSLQGDMPRYLMNGVFIMDFLLDPSFSVDGILTWAQHYFARYPALSIGHHPPLLPMGLVPFFAAFGVSVFAARLAMTACFVVSVWLLYTLGRRLYDARVGAWAALLLATHPLTVTYGQVVMSEMPALMLVLGAFNALFRFRAAGRLGDYLLFVALVGASLAAKQLAAFLIPAYLILLFTGGGWRHFTSRVILVLTIIGMALSIPLVVVTLAMSPYNVAVVVDVIKRGLGLGRWTLITTPILNEHLFPSVGLAAGVGLIVSIVRRDRGVALTLCWIGSVFAGVVLVTGPYDVARFGIYAVPAYCLAAAALAKTVPAGVARTLATIGLTVAVSAQAVLAARVAPAGASGYEEAARFVLAEGPAPTVLYSGSVDTGYFVFFVRKHDPAQRLVVLRSDKQLTTSMMNNLSRVQRIQSRAEIYTMLRRYGTRFVVLEDRPTGSEALDWLREEVRGILFAERARYPIRTTDRRLRGVDVVVYEYLAATPGDPAAEIDMSLPLIGRDIRVRLSDLVDVDAR